MNSILDRVVEKTVRALKSFVDEGTLNPIDSTTNWAKKFGNINRQVYLEAIDKAVKETIFPDKDDAYTLTIENAITERMYGYKVWLTVR